MKNNNKKIKNVFLGHTLEEYKAIYDIDKTIHIDKYAVEEFNKSHLKDTKDSPLEGRLWWLIDDVYYEVDSINPKVNNKHKKNKGHGFKIALAGILGGVCGLGVLGGGGYLMYRAMQKSDPEPEPEKREISIAETAKGDVTIDGDPVYDTEYITINLKMKDATKTIDSVMVIVGSYKLVESEYKFEHDSLRLLIKQSVIKEHEGNIVINPTVSPIAKPYNIDWIATNIKDNKNLHTLALDAEEIYFGTPSEYHEIVESEKAYDCSEARDNSVNAYFKNYNSSNVSKCLYVLAKEPIIFTDNDVDGGQTGTWGLFQDCSNASKIILNNIDTSKMTYFTFCFKGCYSLESIDVSNIDTSNATKFSCMFAGENASKKMKLATIYGLNKFKTSKVEDYNAMFYYCEKLTELDLSSFTKAPLIKDNACMFQGCSLLKTIYCNIDLSEASHQDYTFDGCNQLAGGKGSTISEVAKIDPAGATKGKYARVDKSATDTAGYFTSK